MSKPDRNKHERKPDQGANFRGSYEPSSRAGPKVRVGNKEREAVVRTDMREAVRLTGQWRDENDRYHLFINHAGPHLEMLLALVENGPSGHSKDDPRDRIRTAERVARLGADVDQNHPTLYHLYLCHPDDPLSAELGCGTLRIAAAKRIKLDMDVSDIQGDSKILPKLAKLASSAAERLGTQANLFETYLLQPHVPPEVRSQLWFPPTPTQLKRLPRFIFDGRISANADNYLLDGKGPTKEFGYVDMIRAFYETVEADNLSHSQKKQRLENAAVALDKLVFRGYSEALQHPAAGGGIDEFLVDEWRAATLRSLDDRHITVAGQDHELSLLTHTQDILDSPHGASLRNFETYLHLQHRVNGHYYYGELEVIDLDEDTRENAKRLKRILMRAGQEAAKKASKRLSKYIKAGALLGQLYVRKQDDPMENPDAADEPPEWEAYYALALAGYKLSGSVGGSAFVASKGEARHVYGLAWKPAQLEGPASLVDLGVSMSGGGTGKAGSLTALRCRGSGSGKPSVPLQFNFSGLADLIGIRPGAGIGFTRYAGALIWLSDNINERELPPASGEQRFEYGGQTASGPLHFPINGAGLWPDGERLLQVFAATHLAILRQQGVQLRLDGYADQPHDDFHNEILSRNRAISAYNYLKNILEDDLATEDLPLSPTEAEEEREKKKADDEGRSYDVEIPKARGVVISAHGEPPSDENSKPEYDVQFRRVDLEVEGVVTVALRRKDDGKVID